MKNKRSQAPEKKSEFMEPMKCAPVTKLLDGRDGFTNKSDGYRAIAVKSKERG